MAHSASVRRARMATSSRAMDAARATQKTRVAPRAGAGAARRGRVVVARALGSGTVTRVARLGKNLTFIDILSTTAIDGDGDARTRVMYAKCVEDVPKLVRAGAVIEFEWTPQSESGRARRDDGTYADARNISVKTAAPVHVVANATEKMLDEFVRHAPARGAGSAAVVTPRMIDVKTRGTSSMTQFGICKVVLGGGRCEDVTCAKRHDVSASELKLAQQSRVRARERSRAAMRAERSEDDPHGDGNKESKAVSDRLFAEWCVKTFDLNQRNLVADIAGGSGTLSFEFHVTHGIGAMLVEPRCVSLSPRQRATWNNLRRRGARPDSASTARASWLRSEIWVACAEEQREERMRMHTKRLIAYTDAGSEEDAEDVEASAPPTDPAELAKPPKDVFPSQVPAVVRHAAKLHAKNDDDEAYVAPFTHVRDYMWGRESGVGDFLADAQPSLLVGMHSDQATEAIIDVALSLNVPFAVVPCCVHASTFPNRRAPDGSKVVSYQQFIDYLLAKHPSIQKTFLPFKGRNQVIYRTID